jgi:hypothetical protein
VVGQVRTVSQVRRRVQEPRVADLDGFLEHYAYTAQSTATGVIMAGWDDAPIPGVRVRRALLTSFVRRPALLPREHPGRLWRSIWRTSLRR